MRTRRQLLNHIAELEREREILYESRAWLSDELGEARAEIRRYEKEDRERELRVAQIFANRPDLTPEKGST